MVWGGLNGKARVAAVWGLPGWRQPQVASDPWVSPLIFPRASRPNQATPQAAPWCEALDVWSPTPPPQPEPSPLTSDQRVNKTNHDGWTALAPRHAQIWGAEGPPDWPRPWGDIVAHVASALSPPTAKYNDPFSETVLASSLSPACDWSFQGEKLPTHKSLSSTVCPWSVGRAGVARPSLGPTSLAVVCAFEEC